jgi:hypothetical protein
MTARLLDTHRPGFLLRTKLFHPSNNCFQLSKCVSDFASIYLHVCESRTYKNRNVGSGLCLRHVCSRLAQGPQKARHLAQGRILGWWGREGQADGDTKSQSHHALFKLMRLILACGQYVDSHCELLNRCRKGAVQSCSDLPISRPHYRRDPRPAHAGIRIAPGERLRPFPPCSGCQSNTIPSGSVLLPRVFKTGAKRSK